MAMTIDEIKTIIKKSIPDSIIEITDLAGDGEHYACEVRSASFKGLSLVQQHKLVYNAFGNKMGRELHALSLKTYVK